MKKPQEVQVVPSDPAPVVPKRRRNGGLIGSLLVLGIGVAGFWSLNRLSENISWRTMAAALTEADHGRIAAACLATLISFAGVAAYDVVASRIVAPGRVPWSRALWAGATGNAMSNMLGFHVLTSGAARFRFYQRCGLDAAAIGHILLLSWFGLWLAYLTIAGISFLLDPNGIAVFGPWTSKLLGLLLFTAMLVLFVLAGRGGRVVALRGWRIPVPGRALLLLQLLLGAVDVIGAGLALYVLLPVDIAPPPLEFFIIYIGAVAAGATSHVPGGVGVVETFLIVSLGGAGRADLLAALVFYRVIYFVLPFLLATVGLGIAEWRGLAPRLKSPIMLASRLSRRLAPPIAGSLAFIAGFWLLIGGAGPIDRITIGILKGVFPLALVEGSAMLASLIGLFLMIISNGLFRRLYLARFLTIVLLIVGAATALVRGLDVAAAAGLGVAALLLTLSHKAFYRRAPGQLSAISWHWLAFVGMMLALSILLGLFYYRNVDFRMELWWRFAWNANAPRFLRTSLIIVVALAAIALHLAITRPIARVSRAPKSVPRVVSELLRLHGRTEDNVALLGDKEFLVATDQRAFLAYGRSGRSLVAMGSPVGEPEAREELVWQFRELADMAGLRAVFYAIEPPDLPIYLELGYALLKLGEVARVDLTSFGLEGSAGKDFRYAIRRVERDGLEFEIVPQDRVDSLMPELRIVSDAWLATKGRREKGFTLGRFNPGYLSRFDCAVMRQNGRIVAFANLWESAAASEFSIDLMRFVDGVSPTLMEAFFVHMMLAAKAKGYATFNLGAAPLAGLSDHPLASTWDRIGTTIFRHGDNFYGFEGLRAFKAKFRPAWTPRYLACPPGLAVPQVLLEVSRLISRPPQQHTTPPDN